MVTEPQPTHELIRRELETHGLTAILEWAEKEHPGLLEALAQPQYVEVEQEETHRLLWGDAEDGGELMSHSGPSTSTAHVTDESLPPCEPTPPYAMAA